MPDGVLRELRARFDREDRRDDIYWHSPHRRELLLARRQSRLWRRRLFQLNSFERVCSRMQLEDLIRFVTHLPLLAQMRGWDIAALAESYAQAKSDVQIAARILRNYAIGQSEITRDLLLKIAADIERSPGASSNEISHAVLDFDLVGRRGGASDQRGARRGFVVRDLDAWIPGDVPNRFACIAELATFLGYWGTSSALVRSITLKGKT